MDSEQLGRFPLPDWLQFFMERNVGKKPVWDFPQLPISEEGLNFRQLSFEERHLVLEMFENDPDPWVDKRFKSPEEVYEYVAHQRIYMPYTIKHGGCDWLVFTAEGTPAGLLHMFDFSKENHSYRHRHCMVGFTFSEKFRGTGLPFSAAQHFQDYLFKKMNLLYLVASVDWGNARSDRFLEKLGFEDRSPDYAVEDWENDYQLIGPECRYFERYRSAQARGRILNERKKAAEGHAEWRSRWIKNPDGTWTIPAR